MTTYIRSWGALAIAAFFAYVTGRTLFDDVLTGAPITSAHLQSLAAIVGAIASGHMLVPMLKQAKLATLFGMAIIFVSSTAYVVVSAGARNATLSQAKQIDADRQNRDYAEALDKLADAEADLKTAKETAKASAAAAAKECSSGKKTKCEGREATRDFDAKQVEKAASHVTMMQAMVNVRKPVADPHGGYAHAAKVLAALPYVTADADDIERRLDLLLPFVTVLVAEIGTLVFGGLAIGHRTITVPIPSPKSEVRQTVPKTKSRNTAPLERGRSGRPSDPAIQAFVLDFRTKNKRTPSGTEIIAHFPNCPRSTAFGIAARSRSTQAPVLKLVG